jgi:hypothetical protein
MVDVLVVLGGLHEAIRDKSAPIRHRIHHLNLLERRLRTEVHLLNLIRDGQPLLQHLVVPVPCGRPTAHAAPRSAPHCPRLTAPPQPRAPTARARCRHHVCVVAGERLPVQLHHAVAAAQRTCCHARSPASPDVHRSLGRAPCTILERLFGGQLLGRLTHGGCLHRVQRKGSAIHSSLVGKGRKSTRWVRYIGNVRPTQMSCVCRCHRVTVTRLAAAAAAASVLSTCAVVQKRGASCSSHDDPNRSDGAVRTAPYKRVDEQRGI